MTAHRYIALGELKNLMKNLGEGLNEEELAGMEKVAAADDEEQVSAARGTLLCPAGSLC